MSEPVKAAEMTRIADDAVDAMTRGIDARGRLTVPPQTAVAIIAITRGLARSDETAGLLQRATADPAWARAMLERYNVALAQAGAARARADHEAEAAVLTDVVGVRRDGFN